eukprot:g8891.t1
MRFTSLALLAVVVLYNVHTLAGTELGRVSSSRSLLDIPPLEKVQASCRTKAKATLFVASGRARVSTVSSCAAFASSISSIKEVWDDYLKTIKLKPNATCTVVKIQDVIDLCAQSVAKVYASARGEVDVDGLGEGCFDAESDGDAFAKSFAYVFVNMWLGVTDGLTSAEAEAQVAALTNAFAAVWAGAKASACQKNTGSISDAQESYAAQVKLGIACVFAEVAVKLCKEAYIGNATAEGCDVCKEGELEKYFVATESSANAEVCSNTVTVVDVTEGNATTSDIEPVPCTKKHKICCDEFFKGQKMCLCGRRCKLAPHENFKGVWVNEDKKAKFSCYCEEYKRP